MAISLLCELFLLLQYTSPIAIRNDSYETTLTRNGLVRSSESSGYSTTPSYAPFQKNRRQLPSNLSDVIETMLQNIQAKKKAKMGDESLFEPYWSDGDWVFYRTIRPHKKNRYKTIDDLIITTQKTAVTGENTTEYVNYVCQHTCSDLIENYGTICAQRFNGWKYEARTFYDACDMITENCSNYGNNKGVGVEQGYEKIKFKRDDNWEHKEHLNPWYIIHRGGCNEMNTTYQYAPTNATEVYERMVKYVDINYLQFRTKGPNR